MQQLNVAICDDMPEQTAYLGRLLADWQRSAGVTLRLHSFSGAGALLAYWRQRHDLQLVLLDIQLPGMDGIQLARTLRAQDAALQIVFITGYAEHMAEGYEVAALHYLLKPVRVPQLYSVLDRALAALRSRRADALLPTAEGTRRFFLDEVRWLEAFSHTLALHTAAGTFSLSCTMNAAEKALGKDFFRCHRSYLVNLACVCQVRREELLLDDGVRLPLSRRLYRTAGAAFVAYHGAAKEELP